MVTTIRFSLDVKPSVMVGTRGVDPEPVTLPPRAQLINLVGMRSKKVIFIISVVSREHC